jgi:hypothetical protein
LGKPQRRIGCDSSFATQDRDNSIKRNVDIFCEAVSTDRQRLKEFMLQDVAWMRRLHRRSPRVDHGAQIDPPVLDVFSANAHAQASMIVAEFHIMCIAVTPSEANPPLFIDPDTVLAGSVASQ